MNRSAAGPFARTVSDWSYYQDLRRVAQQIGHAPTTAEYDEHGRYSSRLAYHRVNGWADALTKAGLDPDDRQRRPQQVAPNLPVNPDRDYCERCGRGGDPAPVRVDGEPMALCDGCLSTIRRRGVTVRMGGST